MVRPTHLLESHVSGQMLKKEETEEGETFFLWNISACYVIQFNYNTPHFVVNTFWKGRNKCGGKLTVCHSFLKFPVSNFEFQSHSILNTQGEEIPYCLESMDFGTEIDGSQDFFQVTQTKINKWIFFVHFLFWSATSPCMENLKPETVEYFWISNTKSLV